MDERLLRSYKKKEHEGGLRGGVWGNQEEASKGGFPAGIDWAFPRPRIRAVSFRAYLLVLGGEVAVGNTQRLDGIFSLFVAEFEDRPQ
jgi:hypothetical protein